MCECARGSRLFGINLNHSCTRNAPTTKYFDSKCPNILCRYTTKATHKTWPRSSSNDWPILISQISHFFFFSYSWMEHPKKSQTRNLMPRASMSIRLHTFEALWVFFNSNTQKRQTQQRAKRIDFIFFLFVCQPVFISELLICVTSRILKQLWWLLEYKI